MGAKVAVAMGEGGEDGEEDDEEEEGESAGGGGMVMKVERGEGRGDLEGMPSVLFALMMGCEV